MMRSAMLVLFCRIALVHAASKVKIEAMTHDIQTITAMNFDGVIGKFRDSNVNSLWFYNEENAKDVAFLDTYNKVATRLKDMVKVCAISCTEFSVFCKKQGVTETPAVMIYPLNPMPAYIWDGKMETDPMANKLSKMIADYSVRVTKDNMLTFLTTDPSKPKVVLFTNKKSPPTIWKALSSETVFKRSIKFGFVLEEDKEILSQFNVKKLPAVLMQRGTKAEIKDFYKGDLTFLGLKEWVNLHSESGVGISIGRQDKEETIEEAKPWLVQEVPELTGKSHQDICFKGEGLCVIYLKDGEASAVEIDMLTALSKKYTSQLSDRGAKMKWMWMNVKVEDAYKKLFNPTQLPSAVVFNPHKRLRFVVLDHGEDNEVKGDAASITNLLEKVLGGDGRFKMVPGQKLPTWEKRDAAPKKAEL